MAYLNKVFLIGNLTRDPELRMTPKGTAICQFGIAVNRQFKDESGATRDETTFVDIEAWGKQGETIAKYCIKGRPLYVEGRLKFDQWEDLSLIHICSLIWRQWKCGRTRFAELVKRGVYREKAAMTAGRSRGPWRQSRNPVLLWVFSPRWLIAQGLPKFHASK